MSYPRTGVWFGMMQHFFSVFVWAFGVVMAMVDVSFSILMCYNKCIMRLKVYWKSNLPPSWA